MLRNRKNADFYSNAHLCSFVKLYNFDIQCYNKWERKLWNAMHLTFTLILLCLPIIPNVRKSGLWAIKKNLFNSSNSLVGYRPKKFARLHVSEAFIGGLTKKEKPFHYLVEKINSDWLHITCRSISKVVIFSATMKNIHHIGSLIKSGNTIQMH